LFPNENKNPIVDIAVKAGWNFLGKGVVICNNYSVFWHRPEREIYVVVLPWEFIFSPINPK